VPEPMVSTEGYEMRAKLRALSITAGGAVGATTGYLWFASDPLAGLAVALCGAGVLGWGAHRLVFDR